MKKLTICLIAVCTLALTGCEQTYNSEPFSVKYSPNFEAHEDNQGILTISNNKGKIMIGDFEPAAGPAPQPDMTQAQIDEFPKDISYHGFEGEVSSALFYQTNDEETEKQLKEIQESIVLK